MKWLALFLCVLLLISCVRVAFGVEAIRFSDALVILDFQGLDPKETLQQISDAFSVIISPKDFGSQWVQIWQNVDIINVWEKIEQSVVLIGETLLDLFDATFITVENLLKYPLMGLEFLFRVLLWVIGFDQF